MTITLWLLGLYAGLCGLLVLFQGKLLFLPSRALSGSPELVGLAYRDMWVKTAEGNRVHAWYVPHEEPRATVVFCHGNAGNISHRLETLRLLHDLGLATVILDYPGYGQSEGSPSEVGCYQAAQLVLMAASLEADGGPLVVWGRSLGAAVAARLAGSELVDALILESTFTSVPAMAQELYPWLPARLLCRYRFDTLERVAELEVPKLFVHSREDEIIPYAHAQRLVEAAREPKRLLTIQGDHNGGFLTSAAAYREGVDAFLREVLTE